METNVQEFGDKLGRKVLARDWPGVRELLAPWLRERLSADSVRAFFEDEYKRTLEANDIHELMYPEHPDPEVGGNNHTNATELRKPLSWDAGRMRPVPAEVTDATMRYWMRLQLQCSDDQMEALNFDSFAEVWLAVVETSEGLRVGYWSHGAY